MIILLLILPTLIHKLFYSYHTNHTYIDSKVHVWVVSKRVVE
jgi:hypothetical protein